MTLFDLTVGDMMNESILGRAQERDIIRIEAHQIRDYTLNKQKQVDDYPYGGGHGATPYTSAGSTLWTPSARDIPSTCPPPAKPSWRPTPAACGTITTT